MPQRLGTDHGKRAAVTSGAQACRDITARRAERRADAVHQAALARIQSIKDGETQPKTDEEKQIYYESIWPPISLH